LQGRPHEYPPYAYAGAPFIEQTYDKDMWLHFCSAFSPQVVRVYGSIPADSAEFALIAMYYASDPAKPGDPTIVPYPAEAPVWDHTQTTQMGVTSANLYPACLDPRFPSRKITGLLMPTCSLDFVTKGKVLWRDAAVPQSLGLPLDDEAAWRDNVETWKLRGAIATGMSVFSYLQHRVTHPELARLPPYYDQCDQLR
jgi:hypothetical protein